MNKKYDTLVKTLDQICTEAKPENKKYHPPATSVESTNYARSRAYIHLFLVTVFGILDFDQREKWITDGPYDGGIDGYYIDNQNKRMYFIQSKFRTEEANFYKKNISLSEILKMDVQRILNGFDTDEEGNKYNGKIQGLIHQISKIPDPASYDHKVIILANVEKIPEYKLKIITGGFDTEIYDYNKILKSLLFPFICGTYYCEQDLLLYLNVNDHIESNQIVHAVGTRAVNCEVRVVFVPTIEIAKAFNKYKNSILKHNPRSFLGLKKNLVNSQIIKTIKDTKTNEFALYNNGITFLSDNTAFSPFIAKQHKAQLIITNPQIINGGQTGFALHQIYEDAILKGKDPESLFSNKEVLVKIIKITDDNQITNVLEKNKLIDTISKATNQQTTVTEADRRANDILQTKTQDYIFSNFGYFYERKRGEFWDGSNHKYLDDSLVIDREDYLRVCVACNGMASEARRSGETILFKNNVYYGLLSDSTRYSEFFFCFLCYRALNEIEQKYKYDKKNKFGIMDYGQGIRYGKFAIVSVLSRHFSEKWDVDDYPKKVETIVERYLGKWLDFEGYVIGQSHNKDYFKTHYDRKLKREISEINFNNYYKGKTVNQDVKKYFR
jgi:hypothetical protein